MKHFIFIFLILFIFVSCEEGAGDFEPNNLISNKADEKAEAELAKETGPPAIESVTVSSNKTYVTGEVITFTAKFTKRTRIVNGGSPRLPLTIGGETKYANYVSGSGNSDRQFTFAYTVQFGDLDHDGIELASTWELNGADVEDYSEQDAVLTYTPPALTGRLVDTSGLAINLSEGAYTNSGSVTVNVTYLTGTNMYIGSSCLSGGSLIPTAATNAYNLPSLNSSNYIYVAVENGSGGFSACKTVSIIHDNLDPPTVTGITNSNNASDITSDTAVWNANTDNGPSGISHYEIAVSTTASEANIVAMGNWRSVALATTGSISNGSMSYLSASADYYTLVKTVDRAGNESIAASPSWQVAALSPEQIVSIQVVTATDSSLKVGWPYPDDKGFPITDYTIQYKLASSPTWITINDGVSTNRRFTQTGLSAETNYHFRVRAFNGTNFGAWSPTLLAETLPSIDFVTTPYMAINVGGATLNQLVSFEDDNEIYYGNNSASAFNDNSVISADLDRGKVISVPADDFTVVRGTKPFYIAGRLGSGGDTNKANVTWQTADWIGKSFLFSHSRSNPMKVKVYALTDSTVTVTSNGAPIAGGSATVNEENGHTFTISAYGSYEITSTGFIVAYGYANGNGTQYVDPKPFLPSSNDLIGIPSRSAKVSSGSAGNSYSLYHSDGVNQSRTANAGTTDTFNSRGTRTTFQDDAVRLRADQPIVANSYADANGSCSAPLVPSSFQKKRFALNVQAEWVAFASTNELTITIYEPNAAGTGFEAPVTVNMTRTGANNNTPTKGYEARNYRAGTIIEGTQPFQAYYEPLNDTNAADNDETVMFGWD